YDPKVAEDLSDFAALMATEWEYRLGVQDHAAREAEARAAKALVAATGRHAPVAAAIADRDPPLALAHERWDAEIGLPSSTVDGVSRTIHEVFPAANDQWRESLAHCLTGERVRVEQLQLKFADGRQPWVRV